MTREKRIINLINSLTNGTVTISEDSAKNIISLVENKEGSPFAKLYKYKDDQA